MNKIRYFSIMTIIVMIAMGCSEELVEDLVVDDKTELIEGEVEAVKTDDFVTQQQAIEVANAFFTDQIRCLV